jgi:hypothetical protein
MDKPPLQPPGNCDNLEGKQPEYVMVPRRELEHEHMTLLRRVQQIRAILGWKPLPTGKQTRRDKDGDDN